MGTRTSRRSWTLAVAAVICAVAVAIAVLADATAAIIAAAADSKDLVDDACAKRAVAELTRD